MFRNIATACFKFLLEAKRSSVYRSRNINVVPPDGGDGVLEIRWKSGTNLHANRGASACCSRAGGNPRPYRDHKRPVAVMAS
jgi:hypothetical protein